MPAGSETRDRWTEKAGPAPNAEGEFWLYGSAIVTTVFVATTVTYCVPYTF